LAISFRKYNRGPLEVFEVPTPGVNYVAGADSGEGIGQEDSVLSIFRRDTGFQVCKYTTNQQDPEEFALNCVCLLEYYNQAFVVPEVNNSSGGNLVLVLKNQYRKGKIYKKRVDTKVKHQKRLEYGWRTTSGNRGQLIFGLKMAIKTGFMKIRSRRDLDQLKTFVRVTNTRMEHALGEKDDCVFADGLAWQGFKDVMPNKIMEAVEKERTGLTIDEFVRVCRDHEKKKGDFIIGSDNVVGELSVIV